MNKFRIPDWVLLAACCAFFFSWQLSSFGLIGADEPRYAQVAREMLERHDCVTPTLSGEPWLEKPPLYYWQAIVAYKIFGVSDWAARLPSVIDASAMVFALYWFLRRFRAGPALDGGLILVSSAGVIGFARAASTDMPLAAMFTMAMLCWWAWYESGSRRFLGGSYLFVALATLAKGPVAVFLAVAVVSIFAATQRSWKAIASSLWLPGALAFCVIALPWYVLVQLRNPQFFRVFIIEHNLARFGTNLFHHPEPFWYYIPVALLSWLPWTVFVVAGVIWSVRIMREPEADPLNVFLLIWMLSVIAFFSVSKSKLPGYVLPGIPSGMLLLANYLRNRFNAKPHPGVIILHACVCAALMFAALTLRYTLLQHRFSWARAEMPPLLVSLLVGVGVAGLLFATGFRGLRVATVIPAVLTVAIAVRFGSAPLNRELSARAVSDALTQISPKALPIAGVLISREAEFGLQF